MRNLGLIVAGTILTTSLTFGNYGIAHHKFSCNEVAENLDRNIKSNKENFPEREIEGYFFAYGNSGDVSQDEYDTCLRNRFGELSDRYRIEVIKIDNETKRVFFGGLFLENKGGTTYKIVKKE